ncbi:MAG: hypothetical protein WA700_19355 [Acidobacteriaceae bacterium]
MTLPTRRMFPTSRIILAAAILAALSTACVAQNSDAKKDSDFNLALHANTHVTAADIGLLEYPGAAPYKNPNDKDSDSAVDLGFSFGNIHFMVKAASYVTPDSPAQILAFYRKPLSHYGQVLECDHGKPVGSLTVTRTGLTCSDDAGINSDSKGDSSSGHELRAGRPTRYRLVGIDESHSGSTRFGIAYIEMPKDSDGNNQTN